MMFVLMLSHRPLNGHDKTGPSILTVSKYSRTLAFALFGLNDGMRAAGVCTDACSRLSLLFCKFAAKIMTLTGRHLQRKFNNWMATTHRNEGVSSKPKTRF